MNRRLSTALLTDRIRAELEAVLPATYRYFNTYRHFREDFGDGTAYLTIDVSRRSPRLYSLAFYLGVRVKSLQKQISEVLANPRSLDACERSINCHSSKLASLGPQRTEPSWSVVSLGEYESRAREIRTFISQFALPFLQQHRDPETIRATLLKRPECVINLAPYQQILVTSLMRGQRKQLLDDVLKLENRYANHAESVRRQFEATRHKVLQYSAGCYP